MVAPDDDTAAALARLIDKWEATRPDGTAETRDRPTPGWPLYLRTRLGLTVPPSVLTQATEVIE